MQLSREYYHRITSHANYTRACKNTQGGFHWRTQDPITQVIDRVPLNGITKALVAQFAPKFVYVGRRKYVSGIPLHARQHKLRNNMLYTVKKSKRAIRLDAAEEGVRVHHQLAIYAYCFNNFAFDQILVEFDRALAMQNQTCKSATARAIASFNESNTGRLRWVPIIGDLTVCDTENVEGGQRRRPWATGVDLLVYDLDQNQLVVVEVKTSNGAIVEGRHNMQPPFQDWKDSQLNLARLQLAITTELFARTYASLIPAHDSLAGMILHVPADPTAPVIRYPMPRLEIDYIIQQLTSVGWFTNTTDTMDQTE